MFPNFMKRCCQNPWNTKEQLQRTYKLVLFETALDLLKNNIDIAEIGQVFLLKLLRSKVASENPHRSR